MDKYKLFEIPIYSISRKRFDKKWNERRKELYNAFLANGHTESSARRGVSNAYYPQWVWQYNQIVGYILISTTKSDILLDLYCSTDSVFRTIGHTKHFIIDQGLSNHHFRTDGKTNQMLIEELKNLLCTLKKEIKQQKRNFYIDSAAFDDTIDFLDLRALIDQIHIVM